MGPMVYIIGPIIGYNFINSMGILGSYKHDNPSKINDILYNKPNYLAWSHVLLVPMLPFTLAAPTFPLMCIHTGVFTHGICMHM